MAARFQRVLEAAQGFAPEGSTRRKIVQLIAVILFFQGVSIAVLSSHFGPALGLLSMVLGIVILLAFPPKLGLEGPAPVEGTPSGQSETYGIKLVEYVYQKTGGERTATALGLVLIAGILLYNAYLSTRPDIGDLDLLSMILGGLLVAYPATSRRFKVEMCFTLLFVAFVVVILVIPQAALSSGGDSSAGNWYVHYMLAAPFAFALNLLGIDASAFAEVVRITLSDGTVHMLAISAACAGLYSFSIFVSAFISFMLVFERLPFKVMVLVLSLGLLIAYLGNLLRMVVIGVIGYLYGMDALLWAHNNIGWIVFLGWSSVFWYAVLRYANRRTRESNMVQDSRS